LGIGDWGLGPIPNPQSPIPNPQQIEIMINLIFDLKKNYFKIILFIFYNFMVDEKN